MRSISLAALIAGLLCLPVAADAAVAFDAISALEAVNSADTTFTHTPVGTPRAAIVLCEKGDDVNFINGTVTYGGVNMTEVTGSPQTKATGDNMAVAIWFLGSSIPTGAQTVTVPTAGASPSIVCASITLTASADTEVVDSDGSINTDSLENPSVTLSLSGRTSFAAIVFGSGQADVTAITPFMNWTSRLENDAGVQVRGFYTYDTISTADVTAGWTQTAADAVMVAVAVSEVAASTKKCPGLLLGFAGCP
jgi:hypothetical protein